jgi:hypothetical protein
MSTIRPYWIDAVEAVYTASGKTRMEYRVKKGKQHVRTFTGILAARSFMDQCNAEYVRLEREQEEREREPVAAHAACEQDDAALVLARPDQFETV